ncbi:MAG: hypothetical protein OXS29_00650 [bacterium]|nr:hypothetical protein [bacterium]MDE0290249.1 hypothetical protein [bacterium]MDE0438753.1 hypothetical protein [bacterium]
MQKVLAADPSLLGLGEVILRDVERGQPHGGRLDMLLVDPDTSTRYEVELQLGGTDESHIIRTLEYWDIERRRYPHYDHVAVIVAEEVTSRFFNVISLFNGFIPIVAIQMTALRVADDRVALVFTKVLDHAVLATDEEDRAGGPTDRGYWEKRSTPPIMELVDRFHAMIEEHDKGVELNYTKYYIGLQKNGLATNFVSMIPQKQKMNVRFKIPRSDEVSSKIRESGIGTLPYDSYGNFRVALSHEADIDDHSEVLTDLITIAKPR